MSAETTATGPVDRTALAIGLSMVAIILFDLMGLIIKLLSTHYTAAELSAYRNLVGLVPSAIALWLSPSWRASGRKMTIRQWPIACSRGVIVSIAQLCFYYALGSLAFATATTISYSNAVFMTALAVPILGEKVGPMRIGYGWHNLAVSIQATLFPTAPRGWTSTTTVGSTTTS